MRYELRWTATAKWNDQYGLPCQEDRTNVITRIDEDDEDRALNYFYSELRRMGHDRPRRDCTLIGKARESAVAALHIIGRGRLSLVEVEHEMASA